MAARIVHAHPVHVERVIVEAFDDRRRGHAPHTVIAARHGKLLSGNIHIHRLSCGRLELEGHAMVRQNAWILRTHHIRRSGLGVFDRRSANALRRAAPGKVGIQSLESFLVGKGPVCGVPAKYISFGMLVAEGRPLGHSLAIRIAVLGEIRPVSRHRVGDRRVGCARLPRGSASYVLEDILNFHAMRRAMPSLRRISRIIRVLIEEIIEDLGVALLRLQPRPVQVCQPKAASPARSRAVLGTLVSPAG